MGQRDDLITDWTSMSCARANDWSLPQTSPMATISLHYWAGARAAAGVETESVEAETARSALAGAIRRRSDPRFSAVLAASSLLIGGVVAHQADLDRPLTDDIVIEILPPFAGGSSFWGTWCREVRGLPGRSLTIRASISLFDTTP